jgi:hypothetical protein
MKMNYWCHDPPVSRKNQQMNGHFLASAGKNNKIAID